jgi:hypothetical protein
MQAFSRLVIQAICAVCRDGRQHEFKRSAEMKFVGWWADQPPFNQVGMAFVVSVSVLALLGL